MLDLMCGLLGTPTERIWPGMQCLPHLERFSLPPQPYNYLRKVGGWVGTLQCSPASAATQIKMQHHGGACIRRWPIPTLCSALLRPELPQLRDAHARIDLLNRLHLLTYCACSPTVPARLLRCRSSHS